MSKPKQTLGKDCLREAGDCIEGHAIYISCQKRSDWKKFQKSKQHRGWQCTIRKDATAVILRSYKNIQK